MSLSLICYLPIYACLYVTYVYIYIDVYVNMQLSCVQTLVVLNFLFVLLHSFIYYAIAYGLTVQFQQWFAKFNNSD